MRRPRLMAGLAFALALLACREARANGLSLPDFSNIGGIFQLNGVTDEVPGTVAHTVFDPALNRDVLRLGEAFSTLFPNDPQVGWGARSSSANTLATYDVTSFSLFAEFRITDPGHHPAFPPDEGGHGFTIGWHNDPDGAAAVGYGFDLLGIGDIAGSLATDPIRPGVFVEFDLLKSGTFDLDGNHIGIDQVATSGSLSLLAAAAVSPTFDNGNIWRAWIDYDGAILDVRVTESALRPVSPTLSHAIDIPTALGATDAYLTLTMGQARHWATYDVAFLQFSGGNPIPEPGSLALVALGLLALPLRRRRTRGPVEIPFRRS